MIKLVTAVVKPHVLDAVLAGLREVGVSGMTVTEVRGFGRQGGHTETYRGTEYQVDFIPKLRIELVVAADDVETVTTALTEAARTGSIGDGKVWVTDVDSLARIRTGELGVDAV